MFRTKSVPEGIPQHVAIIMDGNGRWAKRKLLPRYFGHRQGVVALKNAVRFCAKQQIPVLTVYAFSTENWFRPPEEVQFLMDLMTKTFQTEIDELYREGVCVKMLGDRNTITKAQLDLWEAAEDYTRSNTRLTLNVAFNYGGRKEIVHAVKSIATQVLAEELSLEEIDENTVNRFLYSAEMPNPDLVIRTGGDWRISNFLLWQSAYAEWFFTDVLWPDFDDSEFARALASYAKRDRRFGRLSENE